MDLDIQCSDMAGYLYIGNCVVLFLDILSYINNFPPSAPGVRAFEDCNHYMPVPTATG